MKYRLVNFVIRNSMLWYCFAPWLITWWKTLLPQRGGVSVMKSWLVSDVIRNSLLWYRFGPWLTTMHSIRRIQRGVNDETTSLSQRGGGLVLKSRLVSYVISNSVLRYCFAPWLTTLHFRCIQRGENAEKTLLSQRGGDICETQRHAEDWKFLSMCSTEISSVLAYHECCWRRRRSW